MVRILSNGEIVADDDERVKPKQSKEHNKVDQRSKFTQRIPQPEQQPPEEGNQPQQISLFTVLNQRLLAAGLPRWNAGPYTVEPIASVGFLLAGLMFGLNGLLLGLVLFLACMWSQHGIPDFGGMFQGQNPARAGAGQGSGSGQRLGQS